MIRIIGRRLIIPKGDTGFFSLPNYALCQEGDVAVFSVKDKLTRKTIIEKIIDASGDGLLIDAAEINSYYSAFEEPLLIIKEVAKNYE